MYDRRDWCVYDVFCITVCKRACREVCVRESYISRKIDR